MSYSENQDYEKLLKLVIIGDGSVGKSCLIKQFVEGTFSENGATTVGVELSLSDDIIEDTKVRTQIWDTAGQERYKAVTNLYYRKANGVILVYDITNHATFRNIPTWLEEARRHVDVNAVMVLVGNKLDMKHLRTVDREEGQRFAEQENMIFSEASAADSTNVNTIFHVIINQMFQATKQSPYQLIDPSSSKDSFPVSGGKDKTKRGKIKEKCCK